MTWTVLGSTGVVGRQLVSALKAKGQMVLAPGRHDDSVYSQALGNVIYAIGLTGDFRQRPYDTVQAHVCQLLEFLQKANFESFLYLSSTRVYARAASGSETFSLPVCSTDPSDLYNLSKLMGESLCLQHPNPQVRAIRLSNVVGGEDFDSANFIPSLVREAKKGQITLQSTLDSVKDYIHIDDATELMLKIASSGKHRLYNVASGIQTSHQQWTDHLVQLTACHVKVTDNAPSTKFTPIDVERIQQEFKFTPRPTLDAINHYFNPTH